MTARNPLGSPRRASATEALRVMTALLALGFVTGCPGGSPAASPAADGIIAEAESDEEREALTDARDDIDAEMARVASARDAEIERLRRENEELRERLESRGRP